MIRKKKMNNNIINQIDSFIEKTKIYLKPGEKPPKGHQMMRGSKGGLFYDRTTGSLTEDEPTYKQRQAYYKIFRRDPDSSWSRGDIGLRIRQGLTQMKNKRKFKGR
tara:strand:+ start:2731 stop:3048 length:318 start_codon:yes stop_codon:yes gene_type:complete